MSNYFEEWRDYSSESFNKLINKNELKQLEERKLIEEADIQLSKELFQDEKFFKKEIISMNSNKINNLKTHKKRK
jgi:hypothetical protein